MKNLSIILLLIFSSCSSQWHLKKAIKKDPTILHVDTIKVVDTVQFITKEVQKDSVFILSSDTTIIKKDNLTIKHFYSRDSVFLWGECAADTIHEIREIKVPFEKVVYKERFFPKWVWVILFIGLFFIFVFRWIK